MNSDFLRSSKLSLSWLQNPLALTLELMGFSLAIQEMTIDMSLNFPLLYWHGYLQFMDKIIAEIESSYPESINEGSQPDFERDLMAGNFHLLDSD